jgi:hypothetical protein
MNAIPSSSPEKATIKAKGNMPRIKNITPELIMLYVNPLSILSNICPDRILAASLRPNEIFLARYDMNSISTSKGNRPNGQPAGTSKEKKFNPCMFSPKIVAPSTTVKLNEKVRMK